ncbi:MAG TPA: alkaline phosphatase family protein, partial [Chloroflexota bacterium]|nr:alkaline phosphatase family protein [Chloroflexota bacterium]
MQCSPALPPTGDLPVTARSTSAPLAALTPLPPLRHERNLLFATLAGARADLTDKFIADGTMPSLARVSTNGARVQALLPVEPAVAAPAQMSLLTGATPARMGIVADTFHKAGQSLGQSTNGFGAASNVEPFWRSAMRQGRSAAAL